VLRDICEGKGEEVAKQNLRKQGYVGGSSRGLDGIDWTSWKNRFHVDKITVAGHSFGAATIVEVLRNTDRFENVQAGIIYDVWGQVFVRHELEYVLIEHQSTHKATGG
jgi:platelet-activating factor acetylhydrolase